jgi:hypothetical protein
MAGGGKFCKTDVPMAIMETAMTFLEFQSCGDIYGTFYQPF